MGKTDYGRMLIDISGRNENISTTDMVNAMLEEAPKRSKLDKVDIIVRDQNNIVDIYRIEK